MLIRSLFSEHDNGSNLHLRHIISIGKPKSKSEKGVLNFVKNLKSLKTSNWKNFDQNLFSSRCTLLNNLRWKIEPKQHFFSRCLEIVFSPFSLWGYDVFVFLSVKHWRSAKEPIWSRLDSGHSFICGLSSERFSLGIFIKNNIWYNAIWCFSSVYPTSLKIKS